MGRKKLPPNERIVVVRGLIKKKYAKRLQKTINDEVQRINNEETVRIASTIGSDKKP